MPGKLRESLLGFSPPKAHIITAAVATSFILGIWLASLTSTCASLGALSGVSGLTSGQAKRALLVRYNGVLRNMTSRVRTTELALLRLQRLHAAAVQAAEDQKPSKIYPAAKKNEDEAKVEEEKESDMDAEEGGEEEQETEEKQREDEEEEDQDQDGDPAEKRKQEEAKQYEQIQFDAKTQTYRRWRADYRCGSKALPLPDGGKVECHAESFAPCCSVIGWCGSRKEHCKCPGCIDYREKQDKCFVEKRNLAPQTIIKFNGMQTYDCKQFRGECYWEGRAIAQKNCLRWDNCEALNCKTMLAGSDELIGKYVCFARAASIWASEGGDSLGLVKKC